MDSKTPIGDFINAGKPAYNAGFTSSPGELLAHELLGHALGNAAKSKTAGFEDAIQMTNIYWGAQGFGNSYYRSGQHHQGANMKPLSEKVARGIPVHLAITISGDKKY